MVGHFLGQIWGSYLLDVHHLILSTRRRDLCWANHCNRASFQHSCTRHHWQSFRGAREDREKRRMVEGGGAGPTEIHFGARTTCSSVGFKIWKHNFTVPKNSAKKFLDGVILTHKIWHRGYIWHINIQNLTYGLNKNHKVWQILEDWICALFTSLDVRIWHFCGRVWKNERDH